LVVCLEERIDIHNISDMRVIHTIRDIPSNPKGLCALSIDNEKSYLAYPGSSQVGEVQIFDTMNLVREILFLNKQFIGFEMALRKFLKS
jgi:autophagy-related protein 18